ncbi:chondroitinase-B domain-containing protein [Paenibacillus gansuensis]|uniref:Chondroitinase-B domain-containing protein n=1 Tax=Paenibacillus gansuensis TaxID=306542 RepID=A0ABW5PCH4_9BACL
MFMAHSNGNRNAFGWIQMLLSLLLLLTLFPSAKQVYAASLFSDDFETASAFPYNSWTNASSNGSWSIVTDGTKAVSQTSTGNTFLATNGQSAWSNYTYSAKVKTGSTAVRNGIVARYQNSNNYYFLIMYNGSLLLNKKVAGSTSTIQQVSFTANTSTFYELKLEVNGTSLKGYVDGVLMVQGTEASLTSGKIGFYANGVSAFDEVLVDGNAPSSDTSAPSAITNLAAGNPTSSSVQLSWTAPGDDGNTGTASSYDVRYSLAPITDSNFSSASQAANEPAPLVSGTNQTFTVSGLNASTTYYFAIQTKDEAGNASAVSNSVSATSAAGTSGGGNTVNVSTSAQLDTAIANAAAGTTIVVADGTYTKSGSFSISNKNGTSASPITIKAANRNMAVISGSAYFTVTNSSYIVLEGFKFTNTGNSAIKLTSSSYIRMTRNHFRLTENGSSLKWLYIGGANSHHNRIDHNLFEEKHDLGNFITFDGSSTQVSQYDVVEYNHFRNIGPRATNEMEAIRVGWSEISMSDGYITLQYNLFEGCDGDPEIVSIKSGKNIFRYNTIRNSQGVVSSRHGNGNSFYGNFFLGDGTKAGLGGIRIYGQDHKIYNNYFEGLTGSGYDAAIAIDGGDVDTSGALNAHWRVYRAEITNNTLVNNVTGIEIGKNYSLAPVDSKIANNVIKGSAGKLINEYKAPVNMLYEGNIAFPTGTAAVGITATSSQVRQVDPLLSTVDELQKLSAGSPAINASSGTYTYITDDMDGHVRSGGADTGADEYSTAAVSRVPLNGASVGTNAP